MFLVRYIFIFAVSFFLIQPDGHASPNSDEVNASRLEHACMTGFSAFLDVQSLPFLNDSFFMPDSPDATGTITSETTFLEKGQNERLFDLLIPVFAGSVMIGFAGIIRKTGSKPKRIKNFSRMTAEAPYRGAISSYH